MTPAERAAASEFRVSQRGILELKNASEPPGITADVHVHYDRHDCPAQGGRSVMLELREHYVFSKAYLAGKDGSVQTFAGGDPEFVQEGLELAEEAGLRHLSVIEAVIPARRFGWIFTEGKCSHCGMTARSNRGRLVDPSVRPPSDHAIVT